MEIVTARWTPKINMLLIHCVCNRQHEHRADRWWVTCPFCGYCENLVTLRENYYKREVAMYDSYLYRCVFKMDGERMEICGETAFEFQKGFWLTDDYKADGGWLTGTYWVPAHQIIYIKKEKIIREGA